MLYEQYINLSLDLILSMVIYYMRNQMMKISKTKQKKIQYQACLVITGAIQGTSREKIYDELDLHSLAKRRWRSKLIFFYKTVNHLLPDYLYSNLDFYSQENYHLRSTSTSAIRPFFSRTKSFKTSLFSLFSVYNPLGVKLLPRLRLQSP